MGEPIKSQWKFIVQPLQLAGLTVSPGAEQLFVFRKHQNRRQKGGSQVDNSFEIYITVLTIDPPKKAFPVTESTQWGVILV